MAAIRYYSVARQSITAWISAEELVNVRAPIDVDAAGGPWPLDEAAAVICINMIHISPWEATVGLMRGAGRILASGSLLYLYGPYRRSDIPLEFINEAFDRDLQARDAHWGLRELDAIVRCANEHGLAFDRVVEMPANNLSVIFRKA